MKFFIYYYVFEGHNLCTPVIMGERAQTLLTLAPRLTILRGHDEGVVSPSLAYDLVIHSLEERSKHLPDDLIVCYCQ